MAGREARNPRAVAVAIGLSVTATLLAGLVAVNAMTAEQGISQPVPSVAAAGSSQFVRTANVLYGSALLEGNDIAPLYNGRQIFAAMLTDIRRAQKNINFETYIYWSGRIGWEFTKALAERARAGVKVHLVLDAVGSGKMDDGQLETMRQAGVEVEKYHPPRWYNLDRVNNRTHRKLLVVDGRIGFTGGVGIADKWDGDGDSPDEWRDNHYRVTGPAVAQMQAIFVEHWLATKGVLLEGPEYFPDLAPNGRMHAQMISSSADDGSESVRLMYLTSIAAARRSIRLASSYFVPDDLSVKALVDARGRGVDVQIVVPGAHTDSQLTRAASRRRWGALLEAGVEIREFRPTMYHCKVMIVDERWVTVGSTNFDNRSFRLNAEANLNILDEAFAQEQRRAFEADRARARPISLAEWRARPRLERARDWLAGLVESQL